MPSNLGDFWKRLRKLYTNNQPGRGRQPVSVPIQHQQVPQHGPLTVEDKESVIHRAGQQRLMLNVKYDGVSRLVEPYSFRMAKNGKRLFYGFCLMHSKIHSFYVEKIEEVQVTEFHFSPKWPIEL